jgi:translation initiation factor 4E
LVCEIHFNFAPSLFIRLNSIEMSELIENQENQEILESLSDEPEDVAKYTQLHSKWSFYYLRRNTGANFRKDYTESVEKIAGFNTVEHFWRIYDHLQKPNDLKGGNIDFHLFKNDILPAWEDNANKDGGKWLLRCKKGMASRYWEELVLAVIGEQFDVGHEICGIVISMRHNEDRISIWNKTADNQEALAKIRDNFRRILQLPNYVQFEYQRHFDRVEAVSGTAGTTPLAHITTPLKWTLNTGSTGDGSASWKDINDNILFHINPRPRKGIIAMNSQVRGAWQAEETIPVPTGTPPFKLIVTVNNDGFNLSFDGSFQHLFRHRVAWGSFNHVDAATSWQVEGSDVQKPHQNRSWNSNGNSNDHHGNRDRGGRDRDGDHRHNRSREGNERGDREGGRTTSFGDRVEKKTWADGGNRDRDRDRPDRDQNRDRDRGSRQQDGGNTWGSKTTSNRAASGTTSSGGFGSWSRGSAIATSEPKPGPVSAPSAASSSS